MRVKISILFLMLLSLFSCRNDFDFYKERIDAYGHEFADIYGWPSMKQNFNTAMQFTVKVNVEREGEWRLKVYSEDPATDKKKSYLLGNFMLAESDSNYVAKVDGPYTLQTLYVGLEGNGVSAAKSIFPDEYGDAEVSFEEEDFSSGHLPEVPKMSYLIVYEVVDSARTYVDFNDIVLEVIHVSGEETADVKLRAIGAKEDMKIVYRTDTDETVLFESVFGAFGYKKSNLLVNVEAGKHNYRTPVLYRDLYVGSGFTIVDDAEYFRVVTLERKKKTEFAMWPNLPYYYGVPPYALLIANPTWDWISEGGDMEERMLSFMAWVKNYRIYNTWWDTIWDPHELLLGEDGESYQPDFNYLDMIVSQKDIRTAGGSVPAISYQSLEPYTDAKIGANIGFAIKGRNKGRIRILLERSDQGLFEWYERGEDGVCRAYVDVYDRNINVDAGVGCEMESCHILLSTKTMQQIVGQKATLKVILEPGETETTINSVWIRER